MGGYLNLQDTNISMEKITFLWSDSKIRGLKPPIPSPMAVGDPPPVGHYNVATVATSLRYATLKTKQMDAINL